MAKRLYTTFQNMSKIFNGAWNVSNGIANTQPTPQPNDVVYKTEDPAEYQAKMLELQQNKYLQNRWIRSNQNLSMSAFAGLSNVKLMYRDADLMDSYPEIGAALDLTSEECVVTSGSRNGMVVNVSSKSDRIKSILEDLFVNRLNLQVTAQMVMRAMLKYGNQFMLLDIDKNLGVKGWRQLPVGEVERMENGIINPYGGQNSIAMATGSVDNVDMSTKFVWTNEMGGDMVPFRNWQIAHFRLLHNSMFLPYGCLVGDTRVETEFGHKEIKDIEIGDKVWTFNVDTQKRELADVTMHMNKGVKDVFEIRTLHNQIEGTSDHKLLCYENNSLVYKEIQDINIGDLLVIDNSNNKQEKKYDLVNRLENGFKTEKVRYKEYTGKKTTYDITVSNKNSNFFANGIVTHNCSMLLAARRHFRMLALMEDMMLIYRLERSMERRVYKIFVGALDDKDIPGYVEQIADQFKRTPIVDPLTGQLDLRKNILPVWKKTPIPLLDGRTITIEELAKEFDDGKTNYVYSIQDKTHKIVPGKVVWCGKNYTADQLYKITLDDDSYMVMAGEHEIIMRDGSKKRADEVVAGESVMPFYRKNENISYTKEAYYEQVYNPNSGKYEYTHKLIADSIKKNKSTNNTVHHKNFNKFDNRPCNLQWMDLFEHRDYHVSLNKNAKDYIESQKENHKIKCVEVIGGDDVYCMTVVGDNGEEDRHNFAIRTFNSDESLNESGCFVSNCASDDIFIPTRNENMTNPIETLAGAKNLDAIDDIKYIQKKVCAALRIPQSFLNFEEAQGEGKGLALMDVRFARTINRYQQAFLMELTKVATIHLYLLGFDDDLTNFTLTMNNPSTQAEQLELENLSKKISTVRDAVSDPGNGIPAMSLQRALKEIMKWSDKDIKENFEEIRLEKALAAEYEKTAQIIKRTGIFDTVDRIYGEPGAEYQEEQGGGPEGGPDGGPMGGGGGFGGGLDDFGAPGSDEGLEVGGEEGTEPVQDMGAEPAGGGEEPEGMPESKKIKKPLITEGKKSKIINIQNKRTNQIFNRLVENMESKEHEDEIPTRVDVYDKSLMISEEFHAMFNKLDEFKNETLND